MATDPRLLVLEHAERLVQERYHPPGNVHHPGTYVSLSRIVSRPAIEVAEEIIRGLVFEDNDGDREKYWGYLGNTLADEAFHEDDGWEKESRVTLPLQGDWELRGHADAFQAFRVVNGEILPAEPGEPGYVVCGEHKAHSTPTHEKTDKAKRQASLCLALGWRQVKRNGSMTFQPAEYEDDAEPFYWDASWQPAGILVGIAPRYPPPQTPNHLRDDSDLEDYVDFYESKASYIIASVHTARQLWEGDGHGQRETVLDQALGYARDWDEEPDLGGLEFDRNILAMREPMEDMELLLKKRKEANHNKGEWKRKAKKYDRRIIEKAKKMKFPDGETLFEKAKRERIDVGDLTLKIIQRNNARRARIDKLEEAGMDQYLKPQTQSTYSSVK